VLLVSAGVGALTVGAADRIASQSRAASSASLRTSTACWIVESSDTSQTFPVQGSGFEPAAWLNLEVAGTQASTEVRTDAGGSFDTRLSLTGSRFSSPLPTRLTIDAYSTSTAAPPPPPTLLASTGVLAVTRGGAAAIPYGSVHRPVRVSVGGAPGVTIYAHYLVYRPGPRLRYVGTVRVGPTGGPCGALTTKLDLFRHVRPQLGFWTIEFSPCRTTTGAAAALCSGPAFG
jgi:hypothetical protein